MKTKIISLLLLAVLSTQGKSIEKNINDVEYDKVVDDLDKINKDTPSFIVEDETIPETVVPYTPPPNGGAGDAIALENAETKEDTIVYLETEEDTTTANIANPLENVATKEDATVDNVNPLENVETKEDATEVNVVDESSLENVETKEDVQTATNVVVEDALENVKNKDVLGTIVEDEESFRTTGDQEEKDQLEDQLEDEDEYGKKDNKDEEALNKQLSENKDESTIRLPSTCGYVLRRNKLIATKKVLLFGWRLVFHIKPIDVVKGWSSILHATIGSNSAKYGDRTPGIWFHPGTTKLHICAAVNGNKNYCKDTEPLPMNKFSTVVVRQIQKAPFGNHYFYQIIINNKLVVDVLNTVPRVFHDVKYYLADPWHLAARAFVTRFSVVNLKHKDIVTLKRGNTIKFTPYLAQFWTVQFQIKPLKTINSWASILHGTIGGNGGKYGDRTPGVWFHAKTTKLHICSAINGNPNYCINPKQILPLNKYTTVVIRQLPLRRMYGSKQYSTQVHFQILINGKVVADVLNMKPKSFNDVKFHSADPWYAPAFAVVRNFKVFNNLPKY